MASNNWSLRPIFLSIFITDLHIESIIPAEGLKGPLKCLNGQLPFEHLLWFGMKCASNECKHQPLDLESDLAVEFF